MNIYYFGGTFDPPHLGHKAIINYFYKIADLMFLVPTYQSPLKNYSPKCSYNERVEMIRLMSSQLKNLKILNREDNNKLIYTYSTIKFLKKRYKNSIIHLIMGSDQLADFDSWKNQDYIINHCKLVVVSRAGFSIDNSKYKFESSNDINMDISSSEIRKNITNIRLIKTKLDRKVYDYIMRNKLYR